MSLPRFWPESYQCAATITVNFDGESLDQQNSPLPLWGRHSYGRYGAQAGVQRLLDLFDRYDITATFFIPGWDAERYPTVMAAIKDAGHEVAGHGYLHEDFSRLSLAEQERILEQSETSLLHVFGEKPVGWRAPDGLMTKETRALLARRGYRYDSSYADDDLPYVADDGQDHRIAELPLFPALGDKPYYQHYRLPNVVGAALREEFRATYAEGGLFNLALHPRGDVGSGRAVRVRAVESLLQTMREHPKVWLATCRQVADWTLETAEAAGVRPA